MSVGKAFSHLARPCWLAQSISSLRLFYIELILLVEIMLAQYALFFFFLVYFGKMLLARSIHTQRGKKEMVTWRRAKGGLLIAFFYYIGLFYE